MSALLPRPPGARAAVPLPVLGMATWFRRVAARRPAHPALTCDDVCWSFADMQRRIERMAAVLAGGGVVRGDRVAYLGFNDPLFFVAMFAAARCGAIFVPLNFRLSGPEHAFILNDAGVHTLLCSTEHAAVIAGVRGELADALRCITVDGAADPGLGQGWQALADAQTEAGDPPAEVTAASDEVALILYTSGTTGRPKGAMLTHGNVWANNLNGQHAIGLSPDDVLLNFAPLFHVGGLCSIVLPGMQLGGHVVLQRGWDAGAVLDAVGRYRVTRSFAVPSMLIFLSEHPGFAAADLSCLRSISLGGAPCPKPLLELYAARNIPVHQGFGMTETTSTVCLLPPERSHDKLGSSGSAALLCEVCVQDPDGRILATPGLVGELCVRGANVMLGYWNRPEATAAAFDREGWFHTGDVAFQDDEGLVTICDRLKDMIISGGENIYPAEVETVLYAHPAVAEAAVIGAPDDKWGEHVVAVIALRAGHTLTLEGLQTFARQRLAGYKIPRELRLVPALPRNPTGKVLKHELRKRPPA